VDLLSLVTTQYSRTDFIFCTPPACASANDTTRFLQARAVSQRLAATPLRSEAGHAPTQCRLNLRPIGLQFLDIKEAGCGKRRLELDLPFSLGLARQEFGLKVDGGCPRFAAVGEHLEASEINLDAFSDEGNGFFDIIAGEHRDPRRR
jgi:hypothetical protein